MLESIITSKTRIKLLIRFFLNSNTRSYLRGLAGEFGESSNAIRLELNNFEKAGLLNSTSEGNKKFYKANTSHPLFPDIRNILHKHIGLDKIIETVITRLGDLEKVFIIGDFAKGRDSRIIDLIFIGARLNQVYLIKLIEKAEEKINKKIRYIIFDRAEFQKYRKQTDPSDYLLLWEARVI